ncbi:MAG: TIR domain-containing protein [Acidobacteriota bacterium]
MKPLERVGRVSAWSDLQIQPGSQWLEQIQEALASTKVAVLLVTKDFLASDFINENEMTPLLKAAKEDGVEIRWVLVRDCNWKRTPLKDFQAAYPPDKPLAGMNWSRDSAWVAICEAIEKAAN